MTDVLEQAIDDMLTCYLYTQHRPRIRAETIDQTQILMRCLQLYHIYIHAVAYVVLTCTIQFHCAHLCC
jgi:hypothetical protein